MKIKDLFVWVFMFSACALLAIGRLYDERLEVFGVNIGVIFSVVYLLSVIFLLFSIRSIIFSKSKILFYLFYLLILVMGPILWVVFDITEYGFEKAINFWLIVIPISIVVIEKYKRKDVIRTFYILLAVACFLALVSSIGLSISSRTDGRMAALGGGPIVFARWMGFAIFTLLLLPVKINSFLKYSLIVVFFVLALASGSRGPVLAFFLTSIVYIAFNFNRIFIRVSLIIIVLVSFFMFSGLDSKISEIGNTKRVFMNISKKGGNKQSTSTRKNLAIGSFILLQHYPLGVGAGNWQVISNELNPTHLMPLEYPHNLLLEVACEYGVHTLVVLLLLFLYVFHLGYTKMMIYKQNDTSLYPLLFYLLLYLFLNSLVSGMLNDSRLLFVVISFIIINTPLVITDE